MGCWNETDALTKLPIHYGEEIVFFVLDTLPERYHSPSRSLNEDLYSPVGLPFYGTYDDYGSVKLNEDKSAYHQRFVSGLGFEGTAQEFLESISYDDVKSRMGGVYTFMMVKKDIWLTLLEEMGNSQRKMYGDDLRTYRQYFNDTIDEYLAIQDDSSLATTKAMPHFNQSVFGDRLFVQRFWGTIMPYLDGMVTADIRENVIRLLLTNVLLPRLRLGWTPQFGSGSQDSELKLTKTLAREALKEIEKIEVKYDNQ